MTKAIETLFPFLRGKKLHLAENDSTSFPFWLGSAANVHTLRMPHTQKGVPEQLTLILPKEGLSFDQILNVYNQVSQKTGPNTLLVADDINPKHRPLLVRSGIQFVYRDESVFAPGLGLMFKRLGAYKQKEVNGESARQELHPLSLKLIAAHLTSQLPGELTLQALQRRLNQFDRAASLSKLSSVLNELVRLGLSKVVGRGPKKTFLFNDRATVWTKLNETPFSPFMKTMQAARLPKAKGEYVLAGETALSGYSDLTSPKEPTIAMTTKGYLKTQRDKTDSDPSGSVYIQIWKEDPKMFSIKGKLNPVELYLSMREHPDERVQIALGKMLSEYDLAPVEEK